MGLYYNENIINSYCQYQKRHHFNGQKGRFHTTIRANTDRRENSTNYSENTANTQNDFGLILKKKIINFELMEKTYIYYENAL